MKTGFASADELNNKLNMYPRNHIPDELQKRLKVVFDVPGESEHDEFSYRDIELELEGQIIKLSFPLFPATLPLFDLVISSFNIDIKNRKGKGKVATRIGISTDSFLAPRSTEDANFCSMFLSGDSDLTDELSDHERVVFRQWLQANGVSDLDSELASSNDEFRCCLRDSIWDRVDEIVYVTVSSEIMSLDTGVCTLDGDEEKGFSA